MEPSWLLIIRPKRHILDINFKEIWDYRDLLRMFVKRDIVTVYKQTILGPIWFFVQPIMTTLVYMFVFGNIAGISTDGMPQALFYMGGIVLWNYFSEVFTSTSDTFSANQDMFGKVYFPRLIMPLSKVVTALIKFGIQLVLFLVIFIYFLSKGNTPIDPQVELLTIPLLVGIMAILGLGFGIIFSSLTTKYRDLKFLFVFLVQLLMYATPIIYPLSEVPETFAPYIVYNPMAPLIEAFKFCFLGAGIFDWSLIAYSGGFALIMLMIGIIIFNKTEQKFMDYV